MRRGWAHGQPALAWRVDPPGRLPQSFGWRCRSAAHEVSGVPRRSRDRPIEAVPRRLLTRAEAAASLGMSIAHFERFVQPFVKVVPCGQLLLIEPGSLDRWVQENVRLARAVG